jgi:hypothetical protein
VGGEGGLFDKLKTDPTQSANLHTMKIFMFVENFAKSASMKIDANKFFEIISIR